MVAAGPHRDGRGQAPQGAHLRRAQALGARDLTDAARRELERRAAAGDPGALPALEREWVRAGRGWFGETLPRDLAAGGAKPFYVARDGTELRRLDSGHFIYALDGLDARLFRLARTGRVAAAVDAFAEIVPGPPPAPFPEPELEDVVERGIDRIVIDLAPCPKLSDRSLGGLFRWSERLRAAGRRLVLVAPMRSHARATLMLVGLLPILPSVRESVDEALDLLDEP